MSDLIYIYAYPCSNCGAVITVETEKNVGEQLSMHCPICDDGVTDVTLERMKIKDKKITKNNRLEYTYTVSFPAPEEP
ncbi:MAG TPA: hypothetical protein VE090_02320 [Methylomirabilota bacterium]|nr:hypothetical protein [Methylomirabilota bacterium]